MISKYIEFGLVFLKGKLYKKDRILRYLTPPRGFDNFCKKMRKNFEIGCLEYCDTTRCSVMLKFTAEFSSRLKKKK